MAARMRLEPLPRPPTCNPGSNHMLKIFDTLHMTLGDLTPLCRDPSAGSGCWRADCRSACCARPEEAAIRSRWQHDAVPPWRRVEPTMVCEVRVTNLDLGRLARFPVAFVRWRTPSLPPPRPPDQRPAMSQSGRGDGRNAASSCPETSWTYQHRDIDQDARSEGNAHLHGLRRGRAAGRVRARKSLQRIPGISGALRRVAAAESAWPSCPCFSEPSSEAHPSYDAIHLFHGNVQLGSDDAGRARQAAEARDRSV